MRSSPRAAAACAACAALAGVLSCGDLPEAPSNEPPSPGPPVAVSFTVQTTATGPRVPPDFLGLGFETPVMADPHLSDPVLARLLENLGPGSLRFGGGSVETTVWTPVHSGAAGDFRLTPAAVDAVFALARSIGWRVTVAVPFARFDPAAAAAEAAYLVASGGDALLGVEMGNEPNLYALQGLRSPQYSVDSLAADFDAYAAAILSQAPAAPLVGPATWCTGGGVWFAGFLDRVQAPLAFTSHHFYPMGRTAPGDSPEHATVDNMLSPELMARTRACVDSAAGPAASRNLALRIDETNSAYGFGQPGVSDVFASALWGVDHLFTLAELGVAGVNVQTGTDPQGGLTCAGVYLPVCADDGGKFTARPLYYAMLMFHLAAVGRLVPVQVTAPPDARVVAHAAVGDDGTVRVTLVNKSDATPVDATIALDAGAGGPAGVLRLRGKSLGSPSGSFGDAAVNDDGSWAPKPPEALAGGPSYAVSVPPASAALVVIGPGATTLTAARSPPGPAAGSALRLARTPPFPRSSRGTRPTAAPGGR